MDRSTQAWWLLVLTTLGTIGGLRLDLSTHIETWGEWIGAGVIGGAFACVWLVNFYRALDTWRAEEAP